MFVLAVAIHNYIPLCVSEGYLFFLSMKQIHVKIYPSIGFPMRTQLKGTTYVVFHSLMTNLQPLNFALATSLSFNCP
ncbi:hypothetical protein PAHAL_2G281500 [Panicum hallii]|uniref:Uncharacterized protein n=1 Tax=Panicum hallii TaxID=206008 RepID=A0A2T8KQT5_9POAL|nr:hypothetical protein PAHAL_2G281500 [Panicum hallii]